MRGPVHQPHLPAHSDPAGQEGEGARLHPRGREGRPQAQGVLHRGTFIAVLGIRIRMFLGPGSGSGSISQRYGSGSFPFSHKGVGRTKIMLAKKKLTKN